MHVSIVLDQPYSVFTNLDVVRGQVILNLNSPANIVSVNVKLEGESRTKLLTPLQNKDEKAAVKLETHKLLYKVQQVFPPNAVSDASSPTSPLAYSQRHFTLNPGQYEYPFEFKIPFNNSCGEANALSALTSSLMRKDVPTRHHKTTLPPTLTAFPDLAEIQYYVKVTVNRKEFYKENARLVQFFNFLPIEPPRKSTTGAESFARRQHTFQQDVTTSATSTSKPKSFFSSRRQGAAIITTRAVPPAFTIDARLPSPAILTCNQAVPLRLVLKRLNNSPEPLFLQTLQIQLIGYTRIIAQDIFRDETNIWMIASHKALGIPIKQGNTLAEEIVIENQPWRNNPLPTSVAPSFDTCNVSRRYELLVLIGIGYGGPYAANTITLPLRHKVQVFSGIKPPPALLAAMSTAQPERKPVQPPRRPSSKAIEASASASASTSLFSPQGQLLTGATVSSTTSNYMQPSATDGDEDEEPPPSYQDVIAQDLPPIDGQRGAYEPPPARRTGGFGTDD